MPTINKLSAVSSVSAGDQFPIYSPNNGDARRAPMSLITSYLEGVMELPATQVSFTPTGTIAATNVQNAIQELATEPFSPPNTQTGATYTVTSTDYALIFNGGATCTVTLPSAASYTGRVFILKTTAAFTVVSASSNVVPLTGGAAGTAILAATAGKFAHIQSDGTNWVVLMAN